MSVYENITVTGCCLTEEYEMKELVRWLISCYKDLKFLGNILCQLVFCVSMINLIVIK